MNPPELDALDKTLRATMHRGRWAAVALLAAVVLAALGVFGWTVVQQETRLQASCQFYRDLAAVALPSHPRPARATIEFQVHALEAYTGEGCGRPPVNEALQHWAAVYHLRIPS